MAGFALHILPVQLSFQRLLFDLPAQHLAVSGCTLHFRASPPPPPRPVPSCTKPAEQVRDQHQRSGDSHEAQGLMEILPRPLSPFREPEH